MDPLKTLTVTGCDAARRLWSDDNGATAIEYAMIAAGVGAVVAGAVTSLGGNLKTTFYDKLAALLQ